MFARITSSLCLCSLVLVASSSSAAILNPGFESAPGGNVGIPNLPLASNWTNVWAATHAAFPQPGNGGLGARFGFSFPGGGTGEQILTDTFAANTQYVFQGYSVDNDANDDDIRFEIGYFDSGYQFLAGSTYSTDTLDWTLLSGVTYTTGSSGPELGQPIVLHFLNATGAGGVWIDNVSLTAEAQSEPETVPEPSTYALGLVGLAGLGLLAWRRRK